MGRTSKGTNHRLLHPSRVQSNTCTATPRARVHNNRASGAQIMHTTTSAADMAVGASHQAAHQACTSCTCAYASTSGRTQAAHTTMTVAHHTTHCTQQATRQAHVSQACSQSYHLPTNHQRYVGQNVCSQPGAHQHTATNAGPSNNNTRNNAQYTQRSTQCQQDARTSCASGVHHTHATTSQQQRLQVGSIYTHSRRHAKSSTSIGERGSSVVKRAHHHTTTSSFAPRRRGITLCQLVVQTTVLALSVLATTYGGMPTVVTVSAQAVGVSSDAYYAYTSEHSTTTSPVHQWWLQQGGQVSPASFYDTAAPSTSSSSSSTQQSAHSVERRLACNSSPPSGLMGVYAQYYPDYTVVGASTSRTPSPSQVCVCA